VLLYLVQVLTHLASPLLAHPVSPHGGSTTPLDRGLLHGPSLIAPRTQEALWEGGGNVGLASIDRNNKATLLFTAPYYTIKSYAKVLYLRMVKLQDVS
jgi:hypothetical protein